MWRRVVAPGALGLLTNEEAPTMGLTGKVPIHPSQFRARSFSSWNAASTRARSSSTPSPGSASASGRSVTASAPRSPGSTSRRGRAAMSASPSPTPPTPPATRRRRSRSPRRRSTSATASRWTTWPGRRPRPSSTAATPTGSPSAGRSTLGTSAGLPSCPWSRPRRRPPAGPVLLAGARLLNVDGPIAGQWTATLATAGFEVVDVVEVVTRRLGGVDNREKRARCEVVIEARR